MFCRTRNLLLMLCGVAEMVIAPMAHAQTFDAATDFSITSNPNGVWQYGYTNTLGSSFIRDTGQATGSLVDTWFGGISGVDGNIYPNISHNKINATVSGGSFFWQAGQMIMHPGPGGQYSDLRFMAPATRTFLLNAFFIGQDLVSTTTDVYIFDNGLSLFSGNINGYMNAKSYTNTLSFTQGDILDVAVGFGSNGNYFYDYTGVSLRLSALNPVPEPGTIALLLAGGLTGASLFLRRRHWGSPE